MHPPGALAHHTSVAARLLLCWFLHYGNRWLAADAVQHLLGRFTTTAWAVCHMCQTNTGDPRWCVQLACWCYGDFTLQPMPSNVINALLVMLQVVLQVMLPARGMLIC